MPATKWQYPHVVQRIVSYNYLYYNRGLCLFCFSADEGLAKFFVPMGVRTEGHRFVRPDGYQNFSLL